WRSSGANAGVFGPVGARRHTPFLPSVAQAASTRASRAVPGPVGVLPVPRALRPDGPVVYAAVGVGAGGFAMRLPLAALSRKPSRPGRLHRLGGGAALHALLAWPGDCRWRLGRRTLAASMAATGPFGRHRADLFALARVFHSLHPSGRPL